MRIELSECIHVKYVSKAVRRHPKRLLVYHWQAGPSYLHMRIGGAFNVLSKERCSIFLLIVVHTVQ